MSAKLWKPIAAVVLILMVGIFCVSTFIGGSTGQLELASGSTTFMKCHWTMIAVSFTAIIGCTSALCTLLAKGVEARRMTAVLTVVTCIIMATLQTDIAIGLCTNADMACHMTALVNWILMAASIILAVLQIMNANPEAKAKPKMQL